MLYTSRYSNRSLDGDQYYTVGISLGMPRFKLRYRLSEQCRAFAPSRALFNSDSTDEEFRAAYVQGLERMGEARVKELLEEIEKRADGQDAVLLCYEDVRDPAQCCHRRFLADWAKEKLGIDMPELPDPSPVKLKKPAEPEPDTAQTSLF